MPLAAGWTFAAMDLLGYRPSPTSLMVGLSIAVGLRGRRRHRHAGKHRPLDAAEDGRLASLEAALKGAGEIGFTIVSISLSLVAVFIPLLLMGGIVGRLFREFAITVTVAILDPQACWRSA